MNHSSQRASIWGSTLLTRMPVSPGGSLWFQSRHSCHFSLSCSPTPKALSSAPQSVIHPHLPRPAPLFLFLSLLYVSPVHLVQGAVTCISQLTYSFMPAPERSVSPALISLPTFKANGFLLWERFRCILRIH